MKKFLVSYSGGKDSMLALDRMLKDKNELVGIFTTTNKDIGSWFHDINLNILENVAKSIDTIFIPVKLREGNEYTEDFENALKALKQQYSIDCIVFGDIDIEEHRIWCSERCNNVGLEAIFPLWQENRLSLVKEFIDKGYKAVIKKVDKNKLPKETLGKTLDYSVLNYFTEVGIDECGENGEYHTLVYDGPIFKQKINLDIKDIQETEYSYNLNINLI
ncbi:diphthine--ammonia ligase [Mycoplasma sp. P36-A1]|uniref:Dph6-related ATP pyrophosphatase n=1 Tax=Mycoplasma sp. P36-A1 TaxID=3252900 RepID=UPI003C2F1105